MQKDATVDRKDLAFFLSTEFTEITLGNAFFVSTWLYSDVRQGLPDGQRIAVKQWGPEHAPLKILALHGFSDNANSFDNLVRALCTCCTAHHAFRHHC
jgi:hypothetical protein